MASTWETITQLVELDSDGYDFDFGDLISLFTGGANTIPVTDSILPVTFTRFAATLTNSTALIAWTTQQEYNSDKFISTIPPDSLFVKIWAMYGIVGFIIWFGIMLYFTGRSAGIIWKTRDPILKNQLSALCGGATGILLASYGNEVLNAMPTSAVVYISWGLIWISPRWDTPLLKTN